MERRGLWKGELLACGKARPAERRSSELHELRKSLRSSRSIFFIATFSLPCPNENNENRHSFGAGKGSLDLRVAAGMYTVREQHPEAKICYLWLEPKWHNGHSGDEADVVINDT